MLLIFFPAILIPVESHRKAFHKMYFAYNLNNQGDNIQPWRPMCLVAQSCPTLCNHLDCSQPGNSVHGNSPDKNTGVGCHAFLQQIFPTQGSKPGLLNCRQILYSLSHQGNSIILEWVAYPFSRGYSKPRNRTGVSFIAGGFFTSWAIKEALKVFLSDSEKVYCCMCSYNCCCLSCIQISEETVKVVWYCCLFKNFPHFLVMHIVKGFHVVDEAEVDVFFWYSLTSSVIQQMLEIWSLVLLPFLNPACTSESSRYT